MPVDHVVLLGEAIRQIRAASGVSNVSDPGAEGNYEALSKYAVDLNEAAAAGKIDPVIGRDEEIRRCMQVLMKPGKPLTFATIERRTPCRPPFLAQPPRTPRLPAREYSGGSGFFPPC
mgnify:CR=1 FL=1